MYQVASIFNKYNLHEEADRRHADVNTRNIAELDPNAYNSSATGVLLERFSAVAPDLGVYVQEAGAEKDMIALSQPPGIPLDNILTYAYEPETRGQSRVYILDTGCDVNSFVSYRPKASLPIS